MYAFLNKTNNFDNNNVDVWHNMNQLLQCMVTIIYLKIWLYFNFYSSCSTIMSSACLSRVDRKLLIRHPCSRATDLSCRNQSRN